MSSNNQEENRSNKEKHLSVDNSDCQASKEEKQQESGETTTIDITKASNTSKDILDIIDTPDVATWNKGTQMKGNAADIIKSSQERGERIEAIAQKK